MIPRNEQECRDADGQWDSAAQACRAKPLKDNQPTRGECLSCRQEKNKKEPGLKKWVVFGAIAGALSPILLYLIVLLFTSLGSFGTSWLTILTLALLPVAIIVGVISGAIFWLIAGVLYEFVLKRYLEEHVPIVELSVLSFVSASIGAVLSGTAFTLEYVVVQIITVIVTVGFILLVLGAIGKEEYVPVT